MHSVLSTHNLSKWTRQILKRYRRSTPSLTLHLFDTYFRFEQQNGVFLFESPMRCFLDYVREQRLPSEMLAIFDAAGVKFYEGCLIVQVHDHRKHDQGSNNCKKLDNVPSSATWNFANKSNNAMNPSSSTSSHPELYRIVLGPSVETLWLDLNQTWDLSDDQAVEIEAKILQLVQPTLCLDPSFEVSAIANHALRTTSLSCPSAGSGDGVARKVKRKDRGENQISEEEEQRLAKRERLMRSMDETLDRPFVPTFARLGFVQQWKEEQDRKKSGSNSAVVTLPNMPQQQKPSVPIQQRPQHPLAQSHLPSAGPLPTQAAPAPKRKARTSTTGSRAGSEAGSPPPTAASSSTALSQSQQKKKASSTGTASTRGAKQGRGRGRGASTGGARVRNMPPPLSSTATPTSQPSAAVNLPALQPQAPTLADLPQSHQSVLQQQQFQAQLMAAAAVGAGQGFNMQQQGQAGSFALPQQWPGGTY